MKVITRAALAAACLAVPFTAWATGGTSAMDHFKSIPALPKNTTVAYEQWIDHGAGRVDGRVVLEEGKDFKQFEASGHFENKPTTPGAEGQAEAAAMVAQYQTAEGRAKLQQMTPAQLMALSQQMQAAMGVQNSQYVGAVSSHDRKLTDHMLVYPDMGFVNNKIVAVNRKRDKLLAAWEKRDQELREEQRVKIEALPHTCTEAASDADPLLVRPIVYEYERARIALAGDYLPQFRPILKEYQAIVGAEAAYADSATARWRKVENPGYKESLRKNVNADRQGAYRDSLRVEKFVKTVSKKAAKSVAEYHQSQRDLAHIEGC